MDYGVPYNHDKIRGDAYGGITDNGEMLTISDELKGCSFNCGQ